MGAEAHDWNGSDNRQTSDPSLEFFEGNPKQIRLAPSIFSQ
jgi:hypothetical protein